MNHSIYKSISLTTLLGVLSFATLTQSVHAADGTKVTTGLFFINGQSETIDSDDVTSTSIPLLISIKKDKLSFGVSVAHLTVKSGAVSEQGMGDTQITLGYDITDTFGIKLKEKFATGDEQKGLSTGENDTSIQLDYFTLANNQSSIFGSLGYKFVGKVSGLDMQDSLYASVGTGYINSNKTSIGVSLDYRQSIFKNLDNQLGLTAFVSKPLNSTYSLSGFAGYDDTQTSSIGVSLTTKF